MKIDRWGALIVVAELEAEGFVSPGRRSTNPRRGRLLLLAALLAIVAVVAVFVLRPGGEGTRHMAKPWSATMALHLRGGAPPPWEYGNRISVLPRTGVVKETVASWADEYVGGSTAERIRRWCQVDLEGWTVMNMHAENLREIMTREGMSWVEVERVGDGNCLVVDGRVPRAWFFTYPRHDWLELVDLRLEYPDQFNTHPTMQQYFGTEWEVVERGDRDGLLARFLPGHRMRFEDVALSCLDEGGTTVAKRVWTMLGVPADHFSVMELQGSSYSGITGTLETVGDRIAYTVTETRSGTRHGGVTSKELKGEPVRVEYRRVD